MCWAPGASQPRPQPEKPRSPVGVSLLKAAPSLVESDMRQDFLLKHIAEAERHVFEAQDFIRQQREIIAQSRENGSDTTHAERILDNTLGILDAHERHLAYLRRLLAK